MTKAKNIALFLVGTCNEDDDPDSRTNVLLHDDCVKDGAQQLTVDFKGVGP